MHTIILHLQNEDPIVGEVEEFPMKTDTMVFIWNPRRRDGKELTYLDQRVKNVAWPISRLTFIEIIPDEEEVESSNFEQG